jgi:NADPH-dependent curcumin reductase CurA
MHPVHLRGFLNKRLHLQAFIAFDYLNEWESIQTELISLILDKSLQYTESVSQGIGSAPDAFIGMLNGHNLGKQLVKLF